MSVSFKSLAFVTAEKKIRTDPVLSRQLRKIQLFLITNNPIIFPYFIFFFLFFFLTIAKYILYKESLRVKIK